MDSGNSLVLQSDSTPLPLFPPIVFTMAYTARLRLLGDSFVKSSAHLDILSYSTDRLTDTHVIFRLWCKSERLDIC